MTEKYYLRAKTIAPTKNDNAAIELTEYSTFC